MSKESEIKQLIRNMSAYNSGLTLFEAEVTKRMCYKIPRLGAQKCPVGVWIFTKFNNDDNRASCWQRGIVCRPFQRQNARFGGIDGGECGKGDI